MTEGEGRLWCELALRLGGTVGELQQRMTYREFRDWAYFAQRFPIGDEAQQILLATFLATYINGHLASGKEKVKPLDVLPFRPIEHQPTTMDQKWIAMLGGFRPDKDTKAN